MSFNIGDTVQVTNPGAVFSTDFQTARLLNAENWIEGRGRNSGHLKVGMLGVVKDVTNNKYLVRMDDEYDYIIDDYGLELFIDDDVIRVGDLVEAIPVEDLDLSVFNSMVRQFVEDIQRDLISLGKCTVTNISTSPLGDILIRIDKEGNRECFIHRFRKVGAVPKLDPNRKYMKVIRKIREMKQRRAKLGYKY